MYYKVATAVGIAARVGDGVSYKNVDVRAAWSARAPRGTERVAASGEDRGPDLITNPVLAQQVRATGFRAY